MPLRVAAYCRVSTDREDQANSLHSQQTYFTQYIQARQDWILTTVYADEGTSRRSITPRRSERTLIGNLPEFLPTGALQAPA